MAVLQRTLLGAGEPALDPHARVERVPLDDDSWVDVAREWLHGADTLLDHLVDRVDWSRGRRLMYDRMVDDPRLSRWYRDGDAPPHRALDDARRALERRYRRPLRTLGLNYYRDGNDSVAFHRDRELRRLDDTLIAVLTLGARRPFLIRPRGGGRSIDVAPASGDLLVMGGRCQIGWEHAVPKVRRAGPRVSCSWRWSRRVGRDDHRRHVTSGEPA